MKWEYFSVNLHKIVFTQRGISGQPHWFTSILIYLGNGKKGGKRLTYGGSEQAPTLQSFSPSNSALLNVQLWELCETCGKVGKRKVFLEDNQDVSGALELTS